MPRIPFCCVLAPGIQIFENLMLLFSFLEQQTILAVGCVYSEEWDLFQWCFNDKMDPHKYADIHAYNFFRTDTPRERCGQVVSNPYYSQSHVCMHTKFYVCSSKGLFGVSTIFGSLFLWPDTNTEGGMAL